MKRTKKWKVVHPPDRSIIKTQPDDQAILYLLTARAYLAILLNKINLDNFTQTADEDTIIATLGTLTSQTT